ncbi:MAG TPA: nucleotide exchange factor GrpE [Gemmatimonadales bacterium]|nr:nucleotide exchange factor GrpE [Gemmatimonadales bacterium]
MKNDKRFSDQNRDRGRRGGPGGDPNGPDEPIHTPAGMADPASSRGRAADGADLASTDMSQRPAGARPEDVQPPAEYAPDPGTAAGVPAEPEAEAVRRLEGEIAELRDRQLRLAAEFDNYRKRVTRERSELSDRAQAAFVLRLLDVLDDLDRIVADSASAPPDALREALTLVDRKLRKELEAAGVERIDPAGETFNPSEHEAVSTVPPPSPAQDHMVSATFQNGYRFKGQLVRPARVQVYSTHGAG